MTSKKPQGEWGELFEIGNVAVHLHLMPNKKVLFWGRREFPGSDKGSSLNEHFTKVFILDPEETKNRIAGEALHKVTPTKTEPLGLDGDTVNLFCAGHCWQPDGTLLVGGGHELDSMGIDQACVYDPETDQWTAKQLMVGGRWYPSLLTLPDGDAIIISGSETQDEVNLRPQAWRNGRWFDVSSPQSDIFSLFPKLYNDPKGRVFIAGPQKQSRFLDLSKNNGYGEWSGYDKALDREAGICEYGASAMYDAGKIIYAGGGGGDFDPPTNFAEIIDLNDASPAWKRTKDMGHRRRHNFATALPDGTVLVTGGVSGKGFNNLDKGSPVHSAEIWDPEHGTWTPMSAEDDDRGYHHTAILMPDGRVLSSGGGEYAPNNDMVPNPAKDSIITAQFFSPPYMFTGDPPTISEAPKVIGYNETITLTIGAQDKVKRVSWARIASVTHTHNMSQSFTKLNHKVEGTKITIEGPSDPNIVPPGHYMLFVVNEAGRPAVAPIIKLEGRPMNVSFMSFQAPAIMSNEAAVAPEVHITQQTRDDKIQAAKSEAPVVIGLTPSCPYGLGSCWGGAFEALHTLSDVSTVRPLPSADDSLAFVYLDKDVLPDIDVWRKELKAMDNGGYYMRGIEMTLSGAVTSKDGHLVLAGTSTRPDLTLAPFTAESKLEWDRVKKEPKPLDGNEADEYSILSQRLEKNPSGLTVQVTGRLQKHDDDKFSLDVRSFKVEDSTATS